MTQHPLIEARRKAGLSQQELAEMIGRDRVTILRIENGHTQPPLQTIAAIIGALAQKNVELSADAFLKSAA